MQSASLGGSARPATCPRSSTTSTRWASSSPGRRFNVDVLALSGIAVGATGAAAAVLAADAWITAKDSLPQKLWAAYEEWYKEPATYLLDRTPAKSFAIGH